LLLKFLLLTLDLFFCGFVLSVFFISGKTGVFSKEGRRKSSSEVQFLAQFSVLFYDVFFFADLTFFFALFFFFYSLWCFQEFKQTCCGSSSAYY